MHIEGDDVGKWVKWFSAAQSTYMCFTNIFYDFLFLCSLTFPPFLNYVAKQVLL